MPRSALLAALLAAVALSCSGDDPAITGLKPEFAGGGCASTVLPNPASVTKAPNSAGTTTFIVKNTCPSTLTGIALASSRTGAVTSVGTPNPPTIPQLAAGASQNVTISYNVGSSGSGTVVLTSTTDFGDVSSGSQTVTVSGSAGLPFGPFGMYSGWTGFQPNTNVFTASLDYTDATQAWIARIAVAKGNHKQLVLAMTDDCHSNDKTTGLPNCNDPTKPGGVQGPYRVNGKFSLALWKGRMDRYRDPAFIKAVADGVADGTILGNSVLDEPPNSTWGGVMTKPIVDQMCDYVRGIFPTLPVGVVAVHWWRRSERYAKCDFIIDQFEYDVKEGGGLGPDTPATFKAVADTVATENGIRIVFSMNILDGGARRTGTSCTAGTEAPNCQMTAGELQAAGLVLGRAGSGLLMWRYDPTFMAPSPPANQSAFSAIAQDLATRPTVSWRRP
jgi:hypothetical protein